MRKELPALFCRYALPQAAGLLLNSVYFIVDGMFIGNRLGREAMAAAGVAVPMLEFMIALSMAIASGCGVLVSLALAKHRGEEERECAMHALIAAVAAGLLLSVLGNLLIHPLAFFLGSTEAILRDVVTYLSIILSLSPFMILSFLLGGLVRNDGHPVHAMGALAVGSLANIALDWLFMYPLDMGIAGAAWATALGPLLSCLMLLPHFLCRRGALFFVPVRPRLHLFGRMLGLGVPAFVMEFSIGMITAITNLAIGSLHLGEMGLAAYLLIGYLMLIILTLFLGMAEGLQPVFSQMKGKGDVEGLKGMRTFSQIVFVFIGGITCVLAFFFSRQFLQPVYCGGSGASGLYIRSQPGQLFRFCLRGDQYPAHLLLAGHGGDREKHAHRAPSQCAPSAMHRPAPPTALWAGPVLVWTFGCGGRHVSCGCPPSFPLRKNRGEQKRRSLKTGIS